MLGQFFRYQGQPHRRNRQTTLLGETADHELGHKFVRADIIAFQEIKVPVVPLTEERTTAAIESASAKIYYFHRCSHKVMKLDGTPSPRQPILQKN